jgi:hypothetical protein
MKSKSDFWLTVHKLAADLEREGSNNEERSRSVCEVLGSLSPATKAVYLDNLETVLSALVDVSAACKGR